MDALDALEGVFVHPARVRGRYAVHDACEGDDVELLKDLLGLNKEEEAAAAKGGEGQREEVGAGDGGENGSGPADEEMKDKIEDDDDDDDSDDGDFGGEEDDDDENSDEADNLMDAFDDSGCTPLHVSLLNGSLECLNLLLQEGADTGVGCEGSPLIHVAVSVGCLDHLRLFAPEAAKAIMRHCGGLETVLIADDFRRTPLHIAADLGLGDIAKILFSGFADEATGEVDSSALRDYLLVRDKLGNTALHYASLRGHADMVDLLLSTANTVKLSGGEGEAAVQLSELLCTTKNYKKCVPLHFALRQGHAQIAFRLLSADASGNSTKCKDIVGNTPLVDAGAYGHGDLKEKISEFRAKGSSGFDVDAEAASLEGNRSEAMQKNKTLIIRSEVCENHFTCRPATLSRGYFSQAPPENPHRLKVLTSREHGGILTSSEFTANGAYLWEHNPPKAKMSDVLRVHEWHYIKHVKDVCEGLSEDGNDVDGIGSLDGDTQISRFTFDAAFVAAGASIMAVDKLMEDSSKGSGVSKVFCAVRPPGHHAGPTGAVSGGSTDPTIPAMGGSHSHGFCLLNNLAVAAAYAMNIYRKKIKKVALVDFDVHHGNGTEACVSSVTPTVLKQRMLIGGNDGSGTYKFEGFVRSHKFKPWVDMNDKDAILFASCQGYGNHFYPGTGATDDTGAQEMDDFPYVGGSRPFLDGPRIINVGIKGPKSERQLWKKAWRDKILPAVASHEPDLILISAGFDAHAKDDMNSGYIGLLECDYEWVTEELVKIANKHSEGRIVSILEGGYRIQGRTVSPFARSVAAHVRALGGAIFKEWSEAEQIKERDREIRIEQEKLRKQQEELQKLLAERQDLDDNPATNENREEAGLEGPSSPKRRRRGGGSIDYVALNAQLEKEAEAAKSNGGE
ncbi:putative histone deacetylase [Chloropicon primus]|uniref:Putative histone deacetylase n=2 Tax=Chloropicon primus TaxID=1764295 RepID=A0A5B8MPV5_9CHLO|nr:putative histone deacetylase [Chloropicon primus]UPR00614.1 putative histone deacetylase [Chloropicon primus]|eukprot:QDZ21400.1 putative histone deacetylase [Chloropicon primus]